MPIHIYNTLSGKKEEFKPIKKGAVGIYNCGPTVYDTAHIGNLRTMIMYDIVRRTFEYEGYFVTQVMNITDVDDKTLKKSREQKKSLEEVTRHYESLFLADLDSLNILTPHKMLRASEHIKDIIEMTSILLEKGIAYPTKDGIYFSIGMFPGYGALAKINLHDEVRERIANDEYEKENPRDFAVWKFFDKDDGDVVWDAPFGKGRPGWHIECSAMATWALGPTIDIHAGGVDLIFPHHTNEIAQSEAASGKPFAHYWMHGGFMNVDDQKMAKSKGNFLKLADLENEGISQLAFRYWLLTSHYRSQVNFSLEAVKAAQTAFVRLLDAFISFSSSKDVHAHAHGIARDYTKEFMERISDDFNMPEAVALAWEMIKDHALLPAQKAEMLLNFDKVFGLGLAGILAMSQGESIPPEITLLADAREEARKAKEWQKADALRQEIEQRGYSLKDIESGYELRKIS